MVSDPVFFKESRELITVTWAHVKRIFLPVNINVLICSHDLHLR